LCDGCRTSEIQKLEKEIRKGEIELDNRRQIAGQMGMSPESYVDDEELTTLLNQARNRLARLEGQRRATGPSLPPPE
jgi:hypothetical protein